MLSRRVKFVSLFRGARWCSTFDASKFFSGLPPKYFVEHQAVINDARNLIFTFNPEKSLLMDKYAKAETTTPSNDETTDKAAATSDDQTSSEKWIKFHSIDCHPVTGEPLAAGDTSGTIIERWFYPELFAKIRSSRATILTGNSGTGKSYFEEYYMYRIARAAAGMDLNDWPADCYGSKDVPNVVCRQMGANTATVYFIKEKKAFDIASTCVARIYDWFNVRGNLHLIEPDSTVEDPPSSFLEMQVFKANSMDPKYKIKEFEKRNPVFYMPVYDLWELKRTAQFFREKYGKGNTKFLELYADDKVEARFAKYNGAIRYVLPLSEKQETLHSKRRDNALFLGDARLLGIHALDDIQNVSGKLMVIRVPTTGLMAYEEYDRLDFAGSDVLDKLLNHDKQNTISEIRALLCRWDNVKSVTGDRLVYEKYFLHCLLHGVKWKQMVWRDGVAKEIIFKRFKAENSVDSVPAHSDMKINTAYFSHNLTFPCADVFFMDDDRDIWAFNLKTGMSKTAGKINVLAGYKSLLKDHLKLDESGAAKRLHYVVVPLHSQAEEKRVDEVAGKFKSISIMHPPKNYEPEPDLEGNSK